MQVWYTKNHIISFSLFSFHLFFFCILFVMATAALYVNDEFNMSQISSYPSSKTTMTDAADPSPKSRRECVLFPTYAYRNPQAPSEWIIRVRGWAVSHTPSKTKQKLMTGLTKSVIGQASSDQALFEERFKYFMATNKRNKVFKVQATGTTMVPCLSTSDDDLVSTPTDSFSNVPILKGGYDDFFSHHSASMMIDTPLRPANPLSSVLSGRRSTHSTISSLSSLSIEDESYQGDREDNNNNHFLQDHLPPVDYYIDSPASTTASMSISSPNTCSTSPSTTIGTPASYATLRKTMSGGSIPADDTSLFKTEASGFFLGTLPLPHAKVLEWARQQDCCDARLLAMRATHTQKKTFTGGNTTVNLVEETGISVISDIDDTIKHTQILHGARTVLANTFFKPSTSIHGMADAYASWYTEGASFHYVSNSPFQLVSALNDFLKSNHFPPGSMHLRLDGSLLSRLVEIPGRAKRDAILSIMADFPRRQFILVGDSGEIDLEIYTKIAMENPGKILKIFIHDVTTPYRRQKQQNQQKKPSFASDLLRANSLSSFLPKRRGSLPFGNDDGDDGSVPALANSISSSFSSSSSSTTTPLSPTINSLLTSEPETEAEPDAEELCEKMAERLRKARDLVGDDVEIVLFTNASVLKEDKTIQKSLWQHWDDQCIDTTM
ncbi:hypothetical protein BC940DRAFT_301349 [Gongronella butleri]|nr:hypothetical protein BC940DRAFT_301349 [Gongronella butleri]